MSLPKDYFEKRNERKEMILFIRAQLRQNQALRQSIFSNIVNFLKIEPLDDLSLEDHLTLALDEELNGNQIHVIV